MVARFSADLVFGSRPLVGGESQRFGGSSLREGGSRESGVGGSGVTWWLALARRKYSGLVCWWERRYSVMVASFGAKLVFGSRAFVDSALANTQRARWFC